MRDIWFLITDHKGIVKILAILIAIFCVVSIGVSSYTSMIYGFERPSADIRTGT